MFDVTESTSETPLLELSDNKLKPHEGIIDTNAWESAINASFEKGDYETITLLRKIQPDLKPDLEKVKERLDFLLVEKPPEWMDTLKKIRNSGGDDLLAESPIVVEELGKLFDRFGLEQNVESQLLSFIKATNLFPTPEQVQLKYKKIINGNHLQCFDPSGLFFDIFRMTKIQPDVSVFQDAILPGKFKDVNLIALDSGVHISEEMVQTAYSRELEKHGYIRSDFVIETKVIPNENIVLQSYERLISKEAFGVVNALQQATGIEHIYTDEEVKSCYSRYLKSNIDTDEGEEIKRIVEITGIKPDPELVQQAALRMLKHKDFENRIQLLENCTGVSVKFPENEIQDQYRQAMELGNDDQIKYIYDVLGVRPTVSAEDAHQFLVDKIDLVDAKEILQLSNVFNVDFHAEPEEIQNKYQQAFERFSSYRIDKIFLNTGQKPDQQLIQTAFERGAYEKFADEKYRNNNWAREIKDMEEKYKVQVSDSLIQSLYEFSAVNADTNGLEMLNEMTGQHLSSELTQKAYSAILSKNDHTIGEKFEKLYELSGGITPELSVDLIQECYLSELRAKNPDINDIQVISKITGVEPDFDPIEIRQIYYQAIANGVPYTIRKLKDFTQIEFTLDDEMLALTKHKLKDELIEIVNSKYGYEPSANNVRNLLEITGLQPEVEMIQEFYNTILIESNMGWDRKIDKIFEATGVQSAYTTDQLSEKAKEYISIGETHNLQRLTEYGSIKLEKDVVLQGYDVLLGLIKDDYGYEREWFDRFKIIRSITGISYSPEQFNSIASNLLADGRYTGGPQPELALFDILKDFSDQEPSSEILNSVYTFLLQKNDFLGLQRLIEKTGLEPNISIESIQNVVDNIFQNDNKGYLSKIKRILKLEVLPISVELAQEEYKKLADSELFGKENVEGEPIRYFYKLYNDTGVKPQLTSEQLSKGFRNVMESNRGEFEEFANVTGESPSEADLQFYLFSLFTGSTKYHLEDAIDFIESNNLFVPVDLVNNAILTNIRKATPVSFNGVISTSSSITRYTGIQPEIDSADIENAVIELAKKAKDVKGLSDNNIVSMVNWFKNEFGYEPSDEVVSLLYENTWKLHLRSRSTSSIDSVLNVEGKFCRGSWEFLQAKYGPPSENAVQSVYVQQLISPHALHFPERFTEIINFTSISPNVPMMQKMAEQRGLLEGGVTVSSVLDKTFQKMLLLGEIETINNLEKKYDYKYQIGDSETQLLYAKVLMGDYEHQIKTYEFIVNNTGILPNKEIIQARYTELFTSEKFDQKKIAHFYKMVNVPPSTEMIKRQLDILLSISFDDGLEIANIVKAANLLETFESCVNKDDVENTISTYDNSLSISIDYSDIIKLIPLLGFTKAETLFPLTFSKTHKVLITNIKDSSDFGEYFVENLSNYYNKEWVANLLEEAVNQYSTANKFIDLANDASTVWIDQPWVEDILSKAKYTIQIKENIKNSWGGPSHVEVKMEGLSETDPFMNHPYRSIQSSMGLGSVIAEKKSAQEVGLNLTQEAMNAVELIRRTIVDEHKLFLDRLIVSQSVPEEDKLALIDPKNSRVTMNNLLNNVQNFIGRYIVQYTEGNLEQLSATIVERQHLIKNILREGYSRYLKIYEVDIPLYDKLYEEFDRLRDSGRYPLEVYLGRDGIYAWIGRKSQDATRRSIVGRTRLEQLKVEGEVVEINPQYLVYPRYFRDYIDNKTKKAFLEQENIRPEMDPLFYDTGYTGTIPEQIMSLMGFDSNDIEERIRLLSARSDNRRVRGIPENARGEIIEYIEHNAKTENSAQGLIIDEKTGKIRHIAMPTSPEEQFYFTMIKQAIARHYTVKERQDFILPENVNFDSDRYYIHVSKKYADVLPQEFIDDPMDFFEKNAIFKTNSEGENLYPDEGVLSFVLKDGTEVIAKKIEFNNIKEAKKEYMILIASKKSGLPAAEPVGFLTGKELEDNSYLLVEKLKGVSGRKFEQFLIHNGNYSEDQISSIMHEVTDKLVEIAQLFRDKLNIDMHWRIKDTIIQFDEKTAKIVRVIPTNWEKVIAYDPNEVVYVTE